MKVFFAFILLFAIACSSIFGLLNNDNELFIQGKWHVNSEQVVGNSLEKNEFFEWKFENGKFTKTGFPKVFQQGRYKVLEDRNDTLKLKLYNQKGTFGKKSTQLEILVDKKTRKLNIDGKKGFSKIAKKSV